MVQKTGQVVTLSVHENHQAPPIRHFTRLAGEDRKCLIELFGLPVGANLPARWALGGAPAQLGDVEGYRAVLVGRHDVAQPPYLTAHFPSGGRRRGVEPPR